MSALAVYQSLWAMDSGRSGQTARTLDESFGLAADAGFEGMAIDLDAGDQEIVGKVVPLYRKSGLKCHLNAYPASMEDMQPFFEIARTLEAETINIVARVLPNSVDEAILVVQDWIEEAEKEEVPIAFETHRNSLINGLGFTAQVLEAVPDMHICVDLSHYVVDHELSTPVDPEQAAVIDRILQRAGSYQGRVASGQQIQLQIDFPQHQQWVVQFLDWWEQGFRYWRSRAKDGDKLVFQTEIGPPDYAMTGPDGMEMSDRWQETLTMRGWVKDLWARLDKEDVERVVTSSGKADSDS